MLQIFLLLRVVLYRIASQLGIGLWSLHLVIGHSRFSIKSNSLTLVPWFRLYLLVLFGTRSYDLFSFLRKVLLPLALLLLHKVVLLEQFLMEYTAYPGEFEVHGYLPRLKPLLYLFLKNYKLFFHLRIDISFLIGRPKAPKCIADDVVSGSCLFNTEYVFS